MEISAKHNNSIIVLCRMHIKIVIHLSIDTHCQRVDVLCGLDSIASVKLKVLLVVGTRSTHGYSHQRYQLTLRLHSCG